MNKFYPSLIKLSGIWFCLISQLLFAQSPVPPPLPLVAQVVHQIDIPSGASSVGDSFWVCESRSLHLAVLMPSDGCPINLTAPDGTVIAWDPTSTTVSCFQFLVQPDASLPPIAYAYHFILNNPANGQWRLDIHTPAPVITDWNGLMTADFVSDLGIGLFSTSDKVMVGASVSVSLAVMDGSTPITSYQLIAKLYREGGLPSETQAVSFAPMTDPASGSVTPVASLTPSQPGTYDLIVVVMGTTAAGSFERLATSSFIAYSPNATLSGPITQRIELSFPKLPGE